MEKHMVRVCIPGIMVKYTMENGIKASSTAMESGKELTMIATLENGTRVGLMDMVFILGQTVTDTKENGTSASSKVTEPTHLQVVILIQESIKMVNQKAEVNIPGVVDKSMLATFKMDSNMEKESGGVARMFNVIVMRESTSKTNVKAKVLVYGLLATHTRVSISTTKEMASVA